MPRRAVLAAVAVVLLGGAVAPALADGDPSVVCLITHADPTGGNREGVCVWAPVPHPLPIPPLPR